MSFNQDPQLQYTGEGPEGEEEVLLAQEEAANATLAEDPAAAAAAPAALRASMVIGTGAYMRVGLRSWEVVL